MSRSKNDESLGFLSSYVWTTPENDYFNDFPTCRVQDQVVLSSSRPLNITYSFAADGSEFGYYDRIAECNKAFGPLLRGVQREVFAELSGIIPVKFYDVSPESAHINLILCDNLKQFGAAGSAGYPNNYGSNVHIQDGYFGVDLETILLWRERLDFDILRIGGDRIKEVLTHETLHSMGLKHTHNYGKQGNPLVPDGITEDSSIMSYTSGKCVSDISSYYERDLLKVISWDKLPPQRTDAGPVDEINLQYAYANGTSIRRDQTDEAFPCPEKVAPSIFPTFLLSFYPQVACGAGVAVIGLLAPAIKQKAEERNYQNVAYAAGLVDGAMKMMTPLSPEETDGSWKQAGVNAAKDIPVAAVRTLVPLGALAHDYVHDVGSAFINRGLYDAFTTAVSSAALKGVFYGASRAVGTVPIYSLYALAHTAKELDDPNMTLTQRAKAWAGRTKDAAKEACLHPCNASVSLVVGTVKAVGGGLAFFAKSFRGVRHVLPGRCFSRRNRPDNNAAGNVDIDIDVNDQAGVAGVELEEVKIDNDVRREARDIVQQASPAASGNGVGLSGDVSGTELKSAQASKGVTVLASRSSTPVSQHSIY